MKMTYTSPNGRISFEVEVSGGKMAFEVAAAIAELFEDPDCGCCKSKNIKPSTRQHEDYKFYELHCLDCGAQLAFGQSKDGKRLFLKRNDKETKPPAVPAEVREAADFLLADDAGEDLDGLAFVNLSIEHGKLLARYVRDSTAPVTKVENDDGVPWCEQCQSWHPVPKNREHHRDLMCKAPYDPMASERPAPPASPTVGECPACHGMCGPEGSSLCARCGGRGVEPAPLTESFKEAAEIEAQTPIAPASPPAGEWTRDVPTKPGVYRHRRSSYCDAVIEEVLVEPNSKGQLSVDCGESMPLVENYASPQSEWFGPLTPPGETGKMLSHDDWCALSRAFHRGTGSMGLDQEVRINEFLKSQIAAAKPLPAGDKP